MRALKITKERLTEGVRLLEERENGAALLLPAKGGGITVPECLEKSGRYLTFFLTVQEAHSMAFNWNFYKRGKRSRHLRRGLGFWAACGRGSVWI